MKNARKWIVYKSILFTALVLGVMAIPGVLYYELYTLVPGNIMIRAGMEQSLDFQVPVSGELYRENPEAEAAVSESVHVEFNRPITILAGAANEYKMNLKLFGTIPFKTVDLQVIQDTELVPAGIPIGIYVKTEGVLVIETGKFKDALGNWREPAAHVLEAGDYIEAVNGVPVTGKKDFIRQVETLQGNEMIMSVIRQGETIKVKLKPEENEAGEYKAGIWIRDSAQGIGTLTFVDERGQFGALGHGINDIDTSALMEVEYGTLYHTKILSVTPGTSGSPGELTGIIQYMEENILGQIEGNTAEGIFGVGNEQLLSRVENRSMPIALKQEIQIGPAEILCTVDGETKRYAVDITKVDYAASSPNRGILLEVTDPLLLAETGGIVQGMSGSPILQNGKIIGAVTHVLVQDSTKGYGVFIENMLESMNKVAEKEK